MFSSVKKESDPRYFLFKNDYHSGPFTKEKIKEMLLKEIVTDTDLICLENTEDWVKVESLFAEPSREKGENGVPPLIAPPVLNQTVEIPRNVSILQCRVCGGEMVKGKAGGRSIFGHGFSLIVKIIILVVGVAFLFIPVIGWIIGLILILYALLSSTGARNKKVWKCLNCGTFFERA